MLGMGWVRMVGIQKRIMLGAGGLQLLGWVGVSVSGVGWVQEIVVGGLEVVLLDRDTTCWVFLRRRITDGLNFMYNSWFKEEVHVCGKYLGELCNQLYKFERDLSKLMCIEFVE